MTDTAASMLETLQASIAALADRMLALPRRLTASQLNCNLEADVLRDALGEAGREVILPLRRFVFQSVKVAESAGDEARVRAAQLYEHAVLLEHEAASDSEGGHDSDASARAARALLLHCDAGVTDIVSVSWDSAAACKAVEKAVRMRGAVQPFVSGGDIGAYHAGDNVVSVTAEDEKGLLIENIEAGDVCVRLEGGSVASATVREAGVVDVVYHVPEENVAPLTLGVSVFGVVPYGSPWTVVWGALEGSAILATVPDSVAPFLHELCGWLPGRTYNLLYRGSHDGMNPSSFHGLCDGKGPTLVLVRCDKGWVFGGYAGVSWGSGPGNSEFVDHLRYASSPDAFLFSVTGPHTTAPVRFPVLADNVDTAVYHSDYYGPRFHGGLEIRGGKWSRRADFSSSGSFCSIGKGYEDVLGQGKCSLTGQGRFGPVELEVYAVTQVK